MFGSQRDEDMAEYDERRRLLLADIKKYEQDRKEFTQYVAQVAKEVRFYLHFAYGHK